MLYGRCVCSSGEGPVRLSVLTVSEMDVFASSAGSYTCEHTLRISAGDQTLSPF